MKIFNIFKRVVTIVKPQPCIVLHESPTSRIVQKKNYSDRYIIARERLINDEWVVTSWLYSGQAKTIKEFQGYFDYDEPRMERINTLGKLKQFECLPTINQ